MFSHFSSQDVMSFIIFGCVRIVFLGTHFLMKSKKINKSRLEWENLLITLLYASYQIDEGLANKRIRISNIK